MSVKKDGYNLGMIEMNPRLYSWLVLLGVFAAISAAQDVVSAVKGTVTKVDAGAKTIAVKAEDGTEHTLHFVERSAVLGAEEAGKESKEAFHGLRKGSKVVVHYSARGSEETVEEVDHIGKGGLRATKGAVSRIDRGGRTIVVKTAHGGEETYQLADHATVDAGKGIAEGAEKTERVTVYYTEEAGRKVAHFFEKTL